MENCTYNIAYIWIKTKMIIFTKTVIMGIALCCNQFPYICVQHQHDPEHDTLCLYIFFHWPFFPFLLINDTIFTMLFIEMLLEFLTQTYIIVLGASVHLHLGMK